MTLEARAWLPQSPLGWLGAIADKELRISSRQRRHYLLRSAYIAGVVFLMIMAWESMLRSGGGSRAAVAARMSSAGVSMVSTLLWGQFVTSQFLAVVLLSAAVGDEVRKRTLDVLMTTPISSVQIVLGKLVSKLLILLVLVGVSLPLLAILRVFGGIPWQFVLAFWTVTLASTLETASLSLLLSTFTVRSYDVILRCFLIMLVLFAIVPAVLEWFEFSEMFSVSSATWSRIQHGVLHANPYAVLGWLTTSWLNPGGGVGFGMDWRLHAGISAVLAAVLLAWSVRRVRRTNLQRLAMQTQAKKLGRWLGRRLGRRGSGVLERVLEERPIRPVQGNPLVWKEQGLALRSRTLPKKMTLLLAGLLLVGSYGACLYYGTLDEVPAHAFFVLVFVLLALVQTASMAATTIPKEKESRTWPILLTTPLSSGDLLKGKCLAVLRSTGPMWTLMMAHVLFFTAVGVLKPISALLLPVGLVGPVYFLLGLGMFCGVSLRSSTAAAVWTFGAAFFFWMIMPGMLMLPFANPVIWAVYSVVLSGSEELMSPGREFGMFLGSALLSIFLCGLLGMLFLGLAKEKMRQNAFPAVH